MKLLPVCIEEREVIERLSRCTQFPESVSFVFNLFPTFNYRFTALKYRNVALKSRTKFG